MATTMVRATTMEQFSKTQENVSMSTPPTILMEIAFKLGITKHIVDKSVMVQKINKKLDQLKN